MKLFLLLFKQANKFVLKPEFYGDGLVTRFLQELRAAFTQTRDPRHAPLLKMINAYLKYVSEHQPPARMAKYLKLCRSALLSIELNQDQQLAAFYMGQALILMPEEYYRRPDFYALETLPDLVRELAGKFKYVDVKRIPQKKKPAPQG